MQLVISERPMHICMQLVQHSKIIYYGTELMCQRKCNYTQSLI